MNIDMTETTQDIQESRASVSEKRYAPDQLLDTLIERLGLKNDAALSRVLDVGPPLISKVRNRRLPLGSGLLIRMHEVSGMSINELRQIMGDRRNKHRASDAASVKKVDTSRSAA